MSEINISVYHIIHFAQLIDKTFASLEQLTNTKILVLSRVSPPGLVWSGLGANNGLLRSTANSPFTISYAVRLTLKISR